MFVNTTRAWASKIAVVGVLSVVCSAIIGLSPLFSLLHKLWTQVYAALAHGYLVVGLAVWLAVRRWKSTPPVALQPNWLAALPAAAMGLALAFSGELGIGSSQLVLLPALLLISLWWALGFDAARILFLPIALVYFALPPWALLDRPLQWLTTTVVNALVRATSIPAYVESNHFHLPAGTFEIALGCSGLNYLITALSLFAFFGAAYLPRWYDRARVVAVAATLAIVANWVRVYLLIAIGHASDMQNYLVRVEHHYFGWILFAATMWPALNFAISLEDPRKTSPSIQPSVRVHVRGIALATVSACVMLAGLRLISGRDAEVPRELGSLPSSIGNWHVDDSKSSSWLPAFSGAITLLRRYRHTDRSALWVFRGMYPRQRADRRIEAPGNSVAGNTAATTSEWQESLSLQGYATQSTVTEATIDGRRIAIRSLKAMAGVPYLSRMQAVKAALLGEDGRTDAAIAAFAAECLTDCVAAHELTRRAALELSPILLGMEEP